MGVVMLGECKQANIKDALKGSRQQLDEVVRAPGKSIQFGNVMHEGRIPVGITVSYEGEPTDPKRILVSALDMTGQVGADELKKHLDEAVEAMDLKELPSTLEDFEEEPFKGWKTAAIEHGLL